VIAVTDGHGQPRPYETDTDDDRLLVTAAVPEGEYAEGRQTYVFTYRLENVARAMDNGVDEFYWNVFTTESPQPVGAFTARISLDADLAGALTGRSACYVGAEGSRDRCELTRDGDAFVSAPVALDPREVVTVAIGFELGTFSSYAPSPFASPWVWAQAVAALGALGAVVWAGIVRIWTLRPAPGRPTIIAEYEPPAGVDALAAAVLLGKGMRAIPAEILEQAVGGALRILEEPGAFRSKLVAELVDPTRADANGTRVLTGLFGSRLPVGATFTFGTYSGRFASAATKVVAATRSRVKEQWHRPVPRHVRAIPSVLAFLFGAATFAIGIVATINDVSWFPTVPLMIAGIASTFVAAALLSRAPLNAAGAEVRDHLRGLKEFITWAEEDRIRMLQSPQGAERRPVDTTSPRDMLVLYEKLLPFAVVFGKEKQWADRLAVLYGSDSPAWWAGSGTFTSVSFSRGVGSITGAATSSSSGSSGGSTGGGSAGGGGGGGSVGGV